MTPFIRVYVPPDGLHHPVFGEFYHLREYRHNLPAALNE